MKRRRKLKDNNKPGKLTPVKIGIDSRCGHISVIVADDHNNQLPEAIEQDISICHGPVYRDLYRNSRVAKYRENRNWGH